MSNSISNSFSFSNSNSNTNVSNLYDWSLKKYTDKGKEKTITDDLVAYYDDQTNTFYINFHAKDYELDDERFGNFHRDVKNLRDGIRTMPDKNTSSVFLTQMYCLEYWLKSVGNSTVVLMADMNTECTVIGKTLKYTNKDGKGIDYYHVIGREMAMSATPYNTTNKQRLLTAQLPKMFKTSKSKGDICIVFYPENMTLQEVIELSLIKETDRSSQITCYGENFGDRIGDHKQESKYPSDHDAVIFREFATFNCFNSGPSFDGSKIGTNTFEFIPEDKSSQLEVYRPYINEVIGKTVIDVLGEQDKPIFDKKGFFDKSVDKFSEKRCDAIDIHMPGDWMPTIIYVDANGEDLWFLMFDKESADEYLTRRRSEIAKMPELEQVKHLNYIERFLLWREKFNEFIKKNSVFMKERVMHLSNAWCHILNTPGCKEFFTNWYDDMIPTTTMTSTTTQSSKTTKLDLVKYLFERGTMVIGLQEINQEDMGVIRSNFPESEYNIVINDTQVSKNIDKDNGVDTFGCIIIKK